MDYDDPLTTNNLADVSQAVIDELWPDYTIGARLAAEIEYTGEFVDEMDAPDSPELPVAGSFEELTYVGEAVVPMGKSLCVAVVVLVACFI